MVFPTTLLDTHTEYYVNGAWVDTASNRPRGGKVGIKITAGGDSELSTLKASTMTTTLDNTNGLLSPRNPNSAYYGQLKRNTPIRMYVYTDLTSGTGMDDADTFARTVAEGWGSTPGGNAYTSLGAGGTFLATDLSVSGGQGLISVPAVSAYRMAILEGLQIEDIDLYATFDTAIANVTGGPIEPCGIILRYNSNGDADYYLVRVEVTATETVLVRLYRDYANVLVDTATVTGLTYSGQPLRVRVRLIGGDFEIKVWEAASSEPASWTTTMYDDTYVKAGGIGFRSGVDADNTNTLPVITYWDDISIAAICSQFYGEISDFPVKYDTTARNVTVPLTAGGYLRRINQGRKTERSPYYRLVNSLTPVAYWQLNDGPDTDLGGSVVLGEPGWSNLGSVVFARVAGPPGAPGNYPEFIQSVSISEPAITAILNANTGNSYTIDFMLRMTLNTSATAWDWNVLYFRDSASNAASVYISGDTSVPEYAISLSMSAPDSGGGFTFASSPIFLPDGAWHHVRLEIAASSSSTYTTSILIDDTYFADDASTGFVHGHLASVTVMDARNIYLQSASMGQVAVFSGTGLPVTYPGFTGHPGETIAARLARLQTQDNVPFAIEGTGARTLMYQRTVGLTKLLEDIRASDFGVLYERNGSSGFVYISVEQLYTRTPIALSHEQLSAPLDMTDDDQRTWNLVTVARHDGSDVTLEQTTGALGSADPPTGVGTYDRGKHTTYVATDSAIGQVAGWLLNHGTLDKPRIGKLSINMGRADIVNDPSLFARLTRLRVGDLISVTDLPACLPPATLYMLVRGYTKTFSNFVFTIDVVGTPADIIAATDTYDSTTARYCLTGVTLNETIDSTDTSFTAAFTTDRLTRTADDATSLPINIDIDGEVMSLTNVTGTTSPQTLTVTRSVNGIVKAHTSGAEILLARETRYAY